MATMTYKVKVTVEMEASTGYVNTIVGDTPRWDGDLATLPEAAAVAVEKAIGPQLAGLVKRDAEIEALKARLHEMDVKPKQVASAPEASAPASTGRKRRSGVVTSDLKSSK